MLAKRWYNAGMETVKRTFVLAVDLDEALKASAERAGRSQNKHLNAILRAELLGAQKSGIYVDVTGGAALTGAKRSYNPDPRRKPTGARK